MLMPYILLEKLAHSTLPTQVYAREDIHKLLALKAAGLVGVKIPEVKRSLGDQEFDGPATVVTVTPSGLAALKQRFR